MTTTQWQIYDGDEAVSEPLVSVAEAKDEAESIHRRARTDFAEIRYEWITLEGAPRLVWWDTERPNGTVTFTGLSLRPIGERRDYLR